jgi:hypothetical protein
MSKNAEYFSTMQAHLKKWDAELEALGMESHKASIAALAAFHENQKRLIASREAAHKTLEDIRFAGDSAGAAMQAGMETAWNKMRDDLASTSKALRS